MTGWVKRSGAIVAAALGLMALALLGLGMLANLIAILVQAVAGVPALAWVMIAAAGPVLFVIWLFTRRRP